MKTLLFLTTLLALSTSSYADGPKHPCKELKEACKASGVKGCMKASLTGNPPSGIDTNLVGQCKDKRAARAAKRAANTTITK